MPITWQLLTIFIVKKLRLVKIVVMVFVYWALKSYFQGLLAPSVCQVFHGLPRISYPVVPIEVVVVEEVDEVAGCFWYTSISPGIVAESPKVHSSTPVSLVIRKLSHWPSFKQRIAQEPSVAIVVGPNQEMLLKYSTFAFS